MLTRTSILEEYIRLRDRYRDVYVDVFEEDKGYTIIIYCGIKPDDKVKLFKELDRLVACIGGEKVEYEDEDILDEDDVEELCQLYRRIGREHEAEKLANELAEQGNRIVGKVDYTQYKYIIRIPLKGGYRIKNYTVDKDALIIKLDRG